MGINTHQLSQQANLELRSQREQIINVINVVREIGMDLLKADKLASDINYRRLLNIIMLYIIIFLLFVCIVLMSWYRIQHSFLGKFVFSHHKHHSLHPLALNSTSGAHSLGLSHLAPSQSQMVSPDKKKPMVQQLIDKVQNDDVHRPLEKMNVQL